MIYSDLMTLEVIGLLSKLYFDQKLDWAIQIQLTLHLMSLIIFAVESSQGDAPNYI